MPTCGYHFTAKAVSFGKGQSAVHTAAYNARTQLQQEREGRQTAEYLSHGATLFSGIFAPKGAPDWVQDREQLWNRAEAAERQKNGQPARNIEFAFPHQLDQQQREWLLKDFVREQFVRKGMIADANIHAPHPGGDERNYHAHVLVTMRELDGENFAKTKNRDWNKREQLEQWRERWAEMGARALERTGHHIEAERWKHGHKTLEAQREAALQRGDKEYAEAVNREATQHRGPHVDAMERKGIETERGEARREILGRAETLETLRAGLAEVERQIAQAERETRRGAEQQPTPDRLQGVARDIWEARQQSDSPQAFKAALQECGIKLAEATPADVEKQKAEIENKREFWIKPFKEGEIVAVTKRGEIYRLTERTTGEKPWDIQAFVSGSPQPFESVARTREMQQQEEERSKSKSAGYDRWRGGPQTGRMVEHQSWALDQIRANQRRQQDEDRQRDQQRAQPAAQLTRPAEEIDPQRLRTDPTYRREVRQGLAQKSKVERTANRGQQPPEIEQERQR